MNRHSPTALEKKRLSHILDLNHFGREDGHEIDDWLRAEAELAAPVIKTAA
jgi:hypothetical protein